MRVIMEPMVSVARMMVCLVNNRGLKGVRRGLGDRGDSS